MAKYKVEVQKVETYLSFIEVEADSSEEAKTKAFSKVRQCGIGETQKIDWQWKDAVNYSIIETIKGE